MNVFVTGATGVLGSPVVGQLIAEPLPRAELVRSLSVAAGRRRLLKPPTLLLRLLGGKDAMFLARSQRVSNRRFHETTGWRPQVRSAREGLRILSEAPAVA